MSVFQSADTLLPRLSSNNINRLIAEGFVERLDIGHYSNFPVYPETRVRFIQQRKLLFQCGVCGAKTPRPVICTECSAIDW